MDNDPFEIIIDWIADNEIKAIFIGYLLVGIIDVIYLVLHYR
jgi:hypothetical protein